MENKLYWLYFFNRKIELQIRDSRLDWKQKWWPTWPKNDFSPKRVERECLLLWPSLLLLLSFCLNMNLLGGSFNNYVDQILPIFDHLPPLEWTIVDILHKTYPLFTWPRMEFLLNTYLPIPVHVGFEWPFEKKMVGDFQRKYHTHIHTFEMKDMLNNLR